MTTLNIQPASGPVRALVSSEVASIRAGLNLPAFTTWSARPDPSVLGAGAQIFVTDIPNAGGGTIFTSDGTRWCKYEWSYLGGTASPAATFTGTTTGTVQASLTIPGSLLGPNGALDVRFRTTVNNTANSKLIQVRLAGVELFHSGPVSQTYQGGTARISNRNAQNSQIGTPLNLSFVDQVGQNSQLTATVDTSIDQTLDIFFTLANSSDTMLLETWEVFFMSRG